MLVLLLLFAVAAPAADSFDSTYINTLNMTDEEIAEVYGVDSTKIQVKPTRQELQEEKEPQYVIREYNHREQVIVGVSVMLCVALAMVMMNNYNPMR
ncbi:MULTISPECIES: hypothetical protein [Fibrobacter]|uniref:Uncharacterized protein n=1 Tax=Fibrobacter intestinalis TaxID=28122 RepID=A0A1M6XSZ9_9BACT|nr:MULTISPECIES: hypothetical protein [Fibrobacter]MDD7298819.1 hypothetical protein [Fibrobacter intestinalis]PBC67958.1 hypothetical protein BGX14_0295 [Fibrobacter sp. UWS1]PBC73188.1 hypothetical protein BGW94_0780 [Fibrobacter sp. NR9]SHL09003.1 hypothetical protein SAMN05720469_13420 [Fibrobacter intestinalis]SJZ48728.1 hypothetical protein SAMN02745108_00731 [Fibrobacter intestinalis]